MNYSVFLDEDKIGVSELENADVPNRVIFGYINFVNKSFDYHFFSDYCKTNSVKATESSEYKFILTPKIPGLKVCNENGIEIKGFGCSIGGTDSEGFEVYVSGVPDSFLETEFSHHVKNYNEKFG